MKGLKVLVVDDAVSVGRIVSEIIEELFPGCEVAVATTPYEAFSALEKSHSIVVSDFNLKNPVYNGVDILAKARQSCAEVLTILMSGDFSDNLPGLSISEADGVIDHFFEKPLTELRQLEKAIQSFIGEKAAQ